MSPNHPRYQDHQRIQAGLERRFVELMLARAREGWTMPAVEAVSGPNRESVGAQCRVRLFDMKGELDLELKQSELNSLFDQFQEACAAGGEDWIRCLVTMLIAPDRKSYRLQWNYKYS